MSHCLVMGASGYLGAQLVSALATGGHRVRALARTVASSRDIPAPAEIHFGDATDRARVRGVLDGVEVVYYLIHSLARPDFAAVDRAAARILAAEADRAGVRQIVYLGGPRPADRDTMSEHLASRAEVGDILAAAATPTLLLEASMVIGTGSTSFELLRSFTRSAPVLPRPEWMSRLSRPIAATDVLYYLRAAAEQPSALEGRFAVAGPETLSYFELVQRCARLAGLPVRVGVPTPIWSHSLAAQAAALATSVPAAVAKPLFHSLEHDLTATAQDVRLCLGTPPRGLTSVDSAIRTAIAAGGASPTTVSAPAPYVDERELVTEAPVDAVWQVITSVGGERGWFTLPGVWRLRGLIDHLAGGSGLYRGRQPTLASGDVLDFWTVVQRNDATRRLVLRADMKMPGTTYLTMTAETRDGETTYHQTITFTPHGLAGHTYWLLQKPAHDVVFGLMARNIVTAARKQAAPKPGHRPRET